MRTGLPASFVTAKDASFRRPRQLLVCKFPKAGPVYLSDQALGPADGLAQTYRPLVVDWGMLADSAGDATAVDAGEIRQMSITLWNGGSAPFSDYFLAEDPENVEVELYQWFVGLADSAKVLLDRFVISDPIAFDEADRLLTLDLVSLTIRYDQPCGDLLTREAWPYAAASDVGKGIPLVFGAPGPIPGLKAKTSQTLTLKGSILAGTMLLSVYEDLAALALPTAGTVLIDEEKIRYSGRTASTLTVIQRGYLSTAAEHLDRRAIVQVITDHTFLLCAGPVAAIAKVNIAGYPAPAGIYTVRPDLNPARIIFSEAPWVKKYGEATRFLQMQFDGVAAGNTALQPAMAYDAADLATAAVIKQGNNVLALAQYTVNPDRGQIMKAYLAVEHWESGNFLSDRVQVSVSGLGAIGWLSRPNPADQIDLVADVDLDHGHSHAIGGEHVHNFTQPAVATAVKTALAVVNPSHAHAGSSGSVEVLSQTSESNSVVWPATGTWASWEGKSRFFTSYSGASLKKVKLWAQALGYRCRLLIDGIVFNEYPNGINWNGAEADISSYVGHEIRIEVAANQLGGDGLQFIRAIVENTVPLAVKATVTAVSATANSGATSAVSGGAVRSSGVVNVKLADDVSNLATANQPLNLVSQENPSRTVVNLFDLTAAVNFDWAWFTNRTIALTYINNDGEARSVFILHAFFDVEYVPTEVVFSDEIAAEVTGLATLVRPQEVVSYLLTTRAGAAASDFDAASLTAIGVRYAAMGYRLDGLIEATATVREALTAISRQCHCRLFPSGGLLKMVLREGHPASKPVVRQLGSANLQLRSLAAARQPLADISNRVQLFYQRDWLAPDSDASGYLQSVTKEDAGSISRFGLKDRGEAYCFDLIGSSTMAAAVADFYIKTTAWPSTFYTFLAYLDQFDLEKEDVVGVTSTFNSMAKMPMVVRAIDRIFGSGKNGAINLCRIVAENLYYLLTKVALADQVLLLESLSIASQSAYTLEDQSQLIDELLILLDLGQTDSVLLAETMELLMAWAPERQDAVTAADTMTAALACSREDIIQADDTPPEFWSHYGFGSGPFGRVRFGGLTEWRQQNPDQVYAFMDLLLELFAVREDTQLVADRLLVSSGFGGHFGAGFGLSPFGR